MFLNFSFFDRFRCSKIFCCLQLEKRFSFYFFWHSKIDHFNDSVSNKISKKFLNLERGADFGRSRFVCTLNAGFVQIQNKFADSNTYNVTRRNKQLSRTLFCTDIRKVCMKNISKWQRNVYKLPKFPSFHFFEFLYCFLFDFVDQNIQTFLNFKNQPTRTLFWEELWKGLFKIVSKWHKVPLKSHFWSIYNF